MRATSSTLPSAASTLDEPQLGCQQMPTTEDVQRQIAVAVVVAVEVAALLLAVQRIVGRIEVDHDPDRRLAMSLHEDVDEQTLDGARVVVELVVPVKADLACMLQPVQRRLAGEHAARLVEHGGERGIKAQRVVVDQVLIAEPEAEDALAQQIGDRCLTRSAMRRSLKASGQPLGRA